MSVEGFLVWVNDLTTPIAALCVSLSKLIWDAAHTALGSRRRLRLGHGASEYPPGRFL